MTAVLFYEKPGCATNAKQKEELKNAGCMLIQRSLLDHGLSPEELYEFLKPLDVSAWFNPSAPKIKKGELDTKNISKEEALALLHKEPILIRRPLMVIGDRKFCGFERRKIKKIFGLDLGNTRVNESCMNADLTCKN
ncbi:MAG: ArsC/Spx/MgsR family protein [Campylobacterota bacterium]|nr:ArsC/Spx/MgsR family protein [Campylobacterota bacterium]